MPGVEAAGIDVCEGKLPECEFPGVAGVEVNVGRDVGVLGLEWDLEQEDPLQGVHELLDDSEVTSPLPLPKGKAVASSRSRPNSKALRCIVVVEPKEPNLEEREIPLFTPLFTTLFTTLMYKLLSVNLRSPPERWKPPN